MVENGLFITLRDERSLGLYLQEGVFSQHMSPQLDDDVHHSSNHYKIMADYACARPGTHVFFFRKRKIYYGGQVVGTDDDIGAFYLNGPTSPMGRRADAPLVWDESKRNDYEAQETDGVFQVPSLRDPSDSVQSFILQFDTDVEMAGRVVSSDDLYFELGKIPYPLQSNTIRGLGFCPLGPGETGKLLKQVEQSTETYDPKRAEVDVPDVAVEGEPVPYQPEYGIEEVSRNNLTNEDHLEASVIANPSLLPDHLSPGDRAIARQAPISPLKPMQIDAVDLCYYDPSFEDGFYPNEIVELKYTQASPDRPDNPGDAEQIQRYSETTAKMADKYLDGTTNTDVIDVSMYAPSYHSEFSETLKPSTLKRVSFNYYDGSSPEFDSRLTSYGGT